MYCNSCILQTLTDDFMLQNGSDASITDGVSRTFFCLIIHYDNRKLCQWGIYADFSLAIDSG